MNNNIKFIQSKQKAFILYFDKNFKYLKNKYLKKIKKYSKKIKIMNMELIFLSVKFIMDSVLFAILRNGRIKNIYSIFRQLIKISVE